MSGWIGVDLDGTLAHWDGWQGDGPIGAPIPAMVATVKNMIACGMDVRIFTARVAGSGLRNKDGTLDDAAFVAGQRAKIEAWCEQHLGAKLAVTAIKDLGLWLLYDDRAVAVERNTGRLLGYRQIAEHAQYRDTTP